MSGRLRIETTARCGAVPTLFFACDALAIDYEVHVRADGAFEAAHGRPGPVLVDDAGSWIGLGPALERLGGARDLFASCAAVALAVRDMVRARESSELHVDAMAALAGRLDDLEAAVRRRALAIDASPIDAASLMLLPRLRARSFDLAPWPTLSQIADALGGHPSYAAAMTRAQRLASIDVVGAEDVLGYWFGAPVRSMQECDALVRRWFMGGAAADAEIRERFGPTIDRALAGGLDGWAETPRGRLALIVVLDQFTRQAFRDRAAAFSGDARALALCLAGLEAGDDGALGTIERVMMMMPLVHAEDLAVQERSVRERRRLARECPPELSAFFETGVEQAEKHRDWIARFGRFPGRNQALGRTSTPEERDFLVDFPRIAPPARYAATLSAPR